MVVPVKDFCEGCSLACSLMPPLAASSLLNRPNRKKRSGFCQLHKNIWMFLKALKKCRTSRPEPCQSSQEVLKGSFIPQWGSDHQLAARGPHPACEILVHVENLCISHQFILRVTFWPLDKCRWWHLVSRLYEIHTVCKNIFFPSLYSSKKENVLLSHHLSTGGWWISSVL